jgi:hypothetical protein
MKHQLLSAFFALAALGFAPAVFAQIPPDCGGPVSQVPPAETCMEACVYCDLIAAQGSTAGYAASAPPPGFCGVVQNDQWIGFLATSTAPTFVLTPSNCLNGNGLEFALYESCSAPPLVCKPGQAGGGTTPLSITTSNLTVGRHYYLLIDGYEGDRCNFSLTASPWVSPPPMGSISPIQGPATVCPSATASYEVPQVTGAGFYTWSSLVPGVRFNGQPSPVTVLAPGGRKVQVSFPANLSGSADLCVKAGNACNLGQTRCRTVGVQPIPPTNLPPVVKCYGDSLPPGFHSTKIVLKSWLGCDSVIQQKVTVKPQIQTNIGARYVCKGDSIVICGKALKATGQIQMVCQSYQGCDSLIVGFLNVLETDFSVLPKRPVLNCANPQLQLTTTSTSGATIWRNAQGQVIGSGNLCTVNKAGLYRVTKSISLGGEICSTVVDVKVTENFTQPAPLKIYKNGSLAAGGSVELKANSQTPDLLYQWIGPQGFISVSQVVQVAVPGTYKVTAMHPFSACTVMGTVEVK